MTRFVPLLLCYVLSMPVTAQQQPVSPSRAMTPWYEQGLKQLTENKPDLGTEIEGRRRRFLEASVRSRYFWYAFTSTLLNITLVGLYLFKRRELDFKLDQAAGWIADLWNQDQFSRNTAREAIRRYNDHVQLCNRVIESQRSGDGIDRQHQDADIKIKELWTELATVRADKLRSEAELNDKRRQVLDLSARVQDLERKLGDYDRYDHSSAKTSVELVRRVNELEQELSHYRQNSKGARVS